MTTSEKLLKRLKAEFPDFFNNTKEILRGYGLKDTARWYCHNLNQYICSYETMTECLKANKLTLEINYEYGSPEIIISC